MMDRDLMERMVARHDDKGLIRELQFLDAYLNIEDYQELTLIDDLIQLELVVKDRIAERFVEIYNASQQSEGE